MAGSTLFPDRPYLCTWHWISLGRFKSGFKRNLFDSHPLTMRTSRSTRTLLPETGLTMRRPVSILIVSSNRDPASSNIVQALITKNGFKQESGQDTETYSKDNIRLL